MIYFIHGYKENPEDVAKELGAKPIQVDWSEPFSEAVFKTNKDDIVVGFSYGAIIAYLIAEKNGCNAILASMTPIHKYSYKLLLRETVKDMPFEKAEKQVKELKSLKINSSKYLTISGDKENMKSDILIKNTGHSLTKKYISSIKKILNKKSPKSIVKGDF